MLQLQINTYLKLKKNEHFEQRKRIIVKNDSKSSKNI